MESFDQIAKAGMLLGEALVALRVGSDARIHQLAAEILVMTDDLLELIKHE